MRVVLGLGLLVLGASYLGWLHPAGDSLAVFRPAMALVLLVLGLIRRGRWGWLSVPAASLALLPILWMARPQAMPEAGLVVYQKNLRFDLADPAGIIADIQGSGADLVLLQEVSQRNRAVPAALLDSHPYQLICDAHTVGAVAILSRLPLQRQVCVENEGMASAKVMTDQGLVGVVALHLHWPWPYQQADQLDRLLPVLAAQDQPVVIGGDFNMVPWSFTDRRIMAATGSHRAGPLRPSFALKGLYPMPIDRILIPEGWTGAVEMRDRLGSDHKGMLLHTAPANM